MPAINFPSLPTIGDIHTENGLSWIWTGITWDVHFVRPTTPIHIYYIDAAAMIADQASQFEKFIYYTSQDNTYYEYLGTTLGTIADYNTIGSSGDFVPYSGATGNVNLGEFGISAGYYKFDTTPTNTPTDQGTMFWDEDDLTVDIILNGYRMKIGEDLFYPVTNQSGGLITKGTSVRFAGTLGSSSRLLIAPFIADGTFPSSYFMGVAAEDIADGAEGKVLWFGRLRGIDTDAYNEGDILYASTTVAGGFQTVVPQAPNNIVQIAAVINKSINQGVIFIRPQLGSNINNDEGVKITNPIQNQTLLYNALTGLWENQLTVETPQNGLISGGIVQWTGSGYTFNVSSATYRIANIIYTSPAQLITLSAPDLTFNRIDVFAVDNNNNVVVIEGTPSATPVKPQVDPSTQLELTSVIVEAATTGPTLNEEAIYFENVEWVGSFSGSGTANFASTNNPYQGTVSAETTNVQNGSNIIWTRSTDLNISNYLTLGLQIRLKATMGGAQNIRIEFLDNANNPVSNSQNLSLDKGLANTYQFVGVILSTFTFTSNFVRKIRITFLRATGSVTFAGFNIDAVKLEGGITPPISINTFIALFDTPSSYVNNALKYLRVKQDQSGIEFVEGEFLPPGGTIGQVLTKASNLDGDAVWQDVTASNPSLGVEPVEEKFTYTSPNPQTFTIAGDPNSRPALYINGQLLDWTFWSWDDLTQLITVTGVTIPNGAKVVARYYTNIPGTAIEEAPINGNQYVRQDGAWTQYIPFTIDGTPSEGDVVTYVGTTPTWVTPEPDLWTDATTHIYRDGAVVIGQTTLISNSIFIARSKTSTGTHNFFHILENAGDYLYRLNQIGQHQFRINATGNGGTFFQLVNSSNANLFSINGLGQITTGYTGTSTAITGIRYLTIGSPPTTYAGLTVKTDNNGVPFMVGYNTLNGIMIAVSEFEGTVLKAASDATNRYSLSVRKFSDDSIYFDVRGDGQIRIGQALTTLGFYGATPIVQPSGDVLTALSNLGLINNPTIDVGATIAGTPNEGDVVTSISGVPTWAAPSNTGGLTNGLNNLTEGLIFKSDIARGSVRRSIFQFLDINDLTIFDIYSNVSPGWPYYSPFEINFRNSHIKIYTNTNSWFEQSFQIINTSNVQLLTVSGDGVTISAVNGLNVTTTLSTSRFYATNWQDGYVTPQYRVTGVSGINYIQINGYVLQITATRSRPRNTTATEHSLWLQNFDGIDTLKVLQDHSIILSNYPTTDPLVAGKLWVDPNSYYKVKVSQGVAINEIVGGLKLVAFSSVILMDNNYRSVHTQTAPIAYTRTLDTPLTNFGNRTEHFIQADGVSGKPTFSADFVLMLDNWNNGVDKWNHIIFKVLPSGYIGYWIYDVSV